MIYFQTMLGNVQTRLRLEDTRAPTEISMPYGVRGRLITTAGTVRTGTYCWLQQLEGGADEQHGLFLGLSPARKMVSFWCRVSQLSRFEYCFFVANHHPRLAFASKVEAQICANDLALRAAAASTCNPLT